MDGLFVPTSQFIHDMAHKARVRVAGILVLLSLVYLTVDTSLNALLAQDGSSSGRLFQLLQANREVLIARGIVISFFMIFSLLILRLMATRDRADRALAEEKERLNMTLQNIVHGVIAMDGVGNIMFMNRVAEQLTGCDLKTAYGKPLHAIYHTIREKDRRAVPEPARRILQYGEEGGYTDTTILTMPDKTERILAENAVPVRDKSNAVVGILLVIRDVTEERMHENEMLKNQKLEAIGVLAGGIAHDFNNILMAISGNIALARHKVDGNSELFGILDDAERATLRAKGLARQLLTFSKGGAPVKELIETGAFIRESADFVLRGSKVLAEYHVAPDLWAFEADKGQINQVINNLVINAVQAMPDGGTIRIGAENLPVTIGNSLPLDAGDYVKVTVADNGPGIPRELQSRLFDPYFTTKKGGNGLGLASCYSIIKRHGGYITVNSVPGHGAAFVVYLPAKPHAAKKPTARFKTQFYTGHGKLLLMDDEETICTVMSKMLVEMSYEVQTAANGQDAVDLYRREKEAGRPFDVVIMDLTIPGGMGGREAIVRLKQIDPKVKAIVSSGYSNDPVMADFTAHGFKGSVSKPYELEELSKTLVTVMAG
ncbi:MAG: ATP-binding protein [Planctomycetota bacterium]